MSSVSDTRRYGKRSGTTPGFSLYSWVGRLHFSPQRTSISCGSYVPYFVFLPILGLCFSIIAFFVIRREYMFYNESDAKLLYVEKALGLMSRDEFLDSA